MREEQRTKNTCDYYQPWLEVNIRGFFGVILVPVKPEAKTYPTLHCVLRVVVCYGGGGHPREVGVGREEDGVAYEEELKELGVEKVS